MMKTIGLKLQKEKKTIKSFDDLFNDNKNDDNIFCGLFSFQKLDVEHRNIDKLNHVTLKGRQKKSDTKQS